MTAPPVGERLARVEEKVDGLRSDVQQVVTSIAQLATQNDIARIQAEVDDVKTSRRWAIATFTPLLVAVGSLAVVIVQAH